MAIKRKLFSKCLQYVEERINSSKQAMEEAQQAANKEGKSSVGDKYETTRAMMQIERDKSAKQLAEALKLKKVLDQMNPDKKTEEITLGSLVQTSNGNFYFAISMGKVLVDNTEVFVISPVSPIGKKLSGLKAGGVVEMNSREFKVERVI
ncbi:3-oxoacyl-ACP synthase [Cytophagales bacterium RKSG123]|nr:3-oxoacyl-ACP synthase [Xanthovirga aplysinae]